MKVSAKHIYFGFEKGFTGPQVMENLKAVLEAADASFADVVKTTVLLDDMANFAAVNIIYGTHCVFSSLNKCVRFISPVRSLLANVVGSGAVMIA